MTHTYKAITETDVFDFYGIASLDRSALTATDLTWVQDRLEAMKTQYLEALRGRFSYWGKNVKGANDIASMITSLKKSLEESIMDQSERMRRSGGGFNILDAITKMNGGVLDEQKTRETKQIHGMAANLANFQSADYPKIAKCVIDLFEAKKSSDIIIAIDTLNSLQHCGGYVLVDFVAGHRDPSDPLGQKVLQGVFDLKKDATSAETFLPKMSPSVQKLVRSQLRCTK